jgi:hypothetical protein
MMILTGEEVLAAATEGKTDEGIVAVDLAAVDDVLTSAVAEPADNAAAD